MQRWQVAACFSVAALMLASCASEEDRTEEAYAKLDDSGVSPDDYVTGQSIDPNGDVRLMVTVDGCLVEIVYDGYEPVIDRVNGEKLGYPVDLDYNGIDRIGDVCENPDGFMWGFWG